MMMMMPTGFRFNPTDEELIELLERKVSGEEMPLHGHFIVERNLYDHEPRHLQWDNSLTMADNERYYYCLRENDSREVSGRGWWKATGHVKKIYANSNNQTVVGCKRPLTFHRFNDNKRNRNRAIKTNWIMHEFSLHSNSTEWRLCKIKYKGKPKAQEEIERIRKAYQFSNYDSEGNSATSTMHPYIVFGEQEQTLQNLDNTANSYLNGANHHFMQNMQMKEMHHQPTLLASTDPFQAQFSSDYYIGDQLEQLADSSEELHTDLWS